jgi:hypothetical protein
MRVFHCDHCGQIVFFENVNCVRCGRALAYQPDLAEMVSLDPASGLWRSPTGRCSRTTRSRSAERAA